MVFDFIGDSEEKVLDLESDVVSERHELAIDTVQKRLEVVALSGVF